MLKTGQFYALGRVKRSDNKHAHRLSLLLSVKIVAAMDCIKFFFGFLNLTLDTRNEKENKLAMIRYRNTMNVRYGNRIPEFRFAC